MKVSVWTGLSVWLLIMLSWFVIADIAAVHPTVKNNTLSVNIGMIYEEDNKIEKMVLNCIKLALSDFYNSNGHYKTRIVLKTRVYSKNNTLNAAAAALYLLKHYEVKAILMGPTSSIDAAFIINLGEKARVPIISYSATNPLLSSIQGSYYIRATPDVLPQAKAIAALVQAFRWREIVPLYVDNDYGAGFISYLADSLAEVYARIPYHGPIPVFATDDQIRHQLNKLKNTSTTVFMVHMTSDLASRLFLIVKDLQMLEEGYVWIATSGATDELGLLDHSVIESMQGVISLQTYVTQTENQKKFDNRIDPGFRDLKLSITGLWAYDAACALARAVEAVGGSNFGFRKEKLSGNFTDLDTLGISYMGPKLLKTLLNTSFIGLAGKFSVLNRQLDSSTYKIINVIGSGSRDIGFWTPNKGITKTLNSSNSVLKAIIWPGDTTITPKGWAILPASGNQLKVGIPVKAFYEELLKVTVDKSTGSLNIKASGFCIDVFEAVMEKLQYLGPYNYFPYPDYVVPTDSYDNLIYQVFLQKFDIVVGDITITANRSLYVDFTLPYTESGVTMVVPARNERRNAWVFLMPLKTDLWVASLCAFIFIAFSIWVLEHRINDEFRGPPLHQAGTSLFYSFSMLVFAQNVQDLIHKGVYVGYQEGSFVKELLKQKGFQETKLVPYITAETLDELLAKGSANGGISAVFDEIPYMKLFLAKYSSKYVMVQPLYKAEGFGFAFPKGSPLASDVSRELLNVIEGDDMTRMEKKWGMPSSNSSYEGNKVSASSLNLSSFGGLFLIVGVVSGLSLLIFTATFLYEYRQIWLYSDASIWRKAKDLTDVFLQRDMEFHTFRRNIMQQSTRNVRSDNKSSGCECEGINTDSGSSPRPSNFTDDRVSTQPPNSLQTA
ncbi:glutamate receptor 2.8-like isoform X3 [Amaranthus tricolor]|uniref:glutamate receptor 2.8-like isoform X3 n=1 Tax=Amaranthus tricolor TaxID=29722 RepID=UPI00258A52E0|nr:glutamate receptor 2.8-like isoform X3 [Amaranthus tricolor]